MKLKYCQKLKELFVKIKTAAVTNAPCLMFSCTFQSSTNGNYEKFYLSTT